MNSTRLNQKKLQRIRSRRLLIAHTYLMLKRGTRYLPPLVRGLLGLILIFLGFLGFLPVLGFWMIPLGLGLLATDIPPFARWIRKQLYTRRRSHQKMHIGQETIQGKDQGRTDSID